MHSAAAACGSSHHGLVFSSTLHMLMHALQPTALRAAPRRCCHFPTAHHTTALHNQWRPYPHRHVVQCQSQLQRLAVAVSNGQRQLGSRLVCSDRVSDADRINEAELFALEDSSDDDSNVLPQADAISVQEGSIVSGVVTSTGVYGAFLDISGVTGLVHIREIRQGFVASVWDELSVGDKVGAVVLKVDPESGRLSLSMKAYKEKMGKRAVPPSIQEGDVVTGVVKTIQDYGALVVVDGFRGLLRISEIAGVAGDTVTAVQDVLSVGQQLQVLVLSVDYIRGRVTCSTKALEEKRLQVGDLVTGVVTSFQPYGAFINAGGVEGLLHIAKVSGERILDMQDVLSVGERLKVLVVGVNEKRGWVFFSTKQLERNPGDMLTNRQAVWDGAEEMAAAWRERHMKKAARQEADVTQLQVGDLVTGVVTSFQPYGALVDAGGIEGLLHIAQVSGERILDMQDVLSVGEQLKLVVVGVNQKRGWVFFSTRALERHPGDMLTNRQAVFDGAEEMAAAWREQRKERLASQEA